MLHLLHHVQLFFFGVLFCKCFSFNVDTSKKQQSVRVWEVGSVRSALKHLVLLLNKEGGNSRLLKFPTVVSERGSEGKRRQLFLAGGGLDRKRIRKVRGPELEHWNPLTSMVPPSVTSEDGCWTAGHLWCFSVVVLSEKKQEELPLFKHMSTVFMGQSKTGFLFLHISSIDNPWCFYTQTLWGRALRARWIPAAVLSGADVPQQFCHVLHELHNTRKPGISRCRSMVTYKNTWIDGLHRKRNPWGLEDMLNAVH